MTIRRWLIAGVMVAVVAGATRVAVAMPDHHVCRDGDHAVRITGPIAGFVGFSDWYCEGTPHPPYPADHYLGRTGHRVPLRLAIAFVGVLLAIALGLVLGTSYLTTPRVSGVTGDGP